MNRTYKQVLEEDAPLLLVLEAMLKGEGLEASWIPPTTISLPKLYARRAKSKISFKFGLFSKNDVCLEVVALKYQLHELTIGDLRGIRQDCKTIEDTILKLNSFLQDASMRVKLETSFFGEKEINDLSLVETLDAMIREAIFID